MSSPEEDEDEDEDDVFIKLHEEYNKILEELQNVHEDYEKTVEIMQRRTELYRKYYTHCLDPIVMEIILTQEHIIKLEMGILDARHDLQTDIAKLTSRIDDLESKQGSK
jgi:hypothetical protein